MHHTIFDPPTVKAILKRGLRGREKKPNEHKNTNNWLVDWSKDWTEDSIASTVQRWMKSECVGSDAQIRFAAEVLEYMKILHRGVIGHDGTPNPLPPDFPIFGPLFSPPTVEYMNIRPVNATSNPFELAKSRNSLGACDPMQYLLEPLHVMSSIFYPELTIDHCPVPGCVEKIERKGFTSTGYRTVYGIESNVKVIGMEFNCPKHKGFSFTSADKFWKFYRPWQLAGVPHFQERSGCTRELFDLIVEMRPQSNVGQLVENINQLHMQYNRRRQSAWLARALREKARGQNYDNVVYPEELCQATIPGKDAKSVTINPSPSETLVRTIYEYFIENQRRDESERYTRTLTGMNVGLDATLKIAKKANIYVKNRDSNTNRTTVMNMFDGGLLTGVNEDKELVIREFLYGNSPIEMGAPLLDYAERCDALGVNFRNEGEVCVDRCCNFRGSVNAALPNLNVGQDLAHVKNRILETVSKKSAHREKLGKELTNAFIKVAADKKGCPAQYHSSAEQVLRLNNLWAKYERIGNVWSGESRATVKLQVRHAERGCLVRRHPELPCHTSGNENWHSRLNSLTRGNASSLTTVDCLLTDGALRFNLNVDIYNLSQPKDSPSRLFRAAAQGSHHLFLLEHVLRQTENLTGRAQPRFLNICPDHRFGLVPRDPTFIGLTFDRYKNLRDSLQEDMKTEGEDIDVFLAPAQINEDNLMQSDNMDLAPSSSETSKRKYSEAFDIINVDDTGEGPSLDPPAKLLCAAERRVLGASGIEECSVDLTQNLLPEKKVFPIFLPKKGDVTSPPAVSSSSGQPTVLPNTSPNIPSAHELTMTSTPPNSSRPPMESRSASTFTQLMGASASRLMATTHIAQGSSAYWRFAALRLQYRWTSAMTDKQWTEAALVYNNPSTHVDYSFYNVAHGLPQDLELRNGATLKRHCNDFEGSLRVWAANAQGGEELTAWKRMQLQFPAPVRAVYSKVTKTGKTAKIKTCRRCGELKDGQGQGQGHPRDNCRDGFPVWEAVPYPIANISMTHRNGSKIVVSPDACLSAFRTAVLEEKVAHESGRELDIKFIHLLDFERLARVSDTESREEALIRGKNGYDFREDRFKGRR